MTQKHRLPVGGWKIESLPPSVHTDKLQWAWSQQRQDPANHTAATTRMEAFLKNNGVKVTTKIRKDIQMHADNLWCSRNPGRCRGRTQAQKKAEALRVEMPWVKPFWEGANKVLSADPLESPMDAIFILSTTASALIHSAAGCEKCSKHWDQIIMTHPVGLVKTMDDARVWLWSAHNLTREGLVETPFADVAKAWNWPDLPYEQLQVIMVSLGFAKATDNEQDQDAQG